MLMVVSASARGEMVGFKSVDAKVEREGWAGNMKIRFNSPPVARVVLRMPGRPHQALHGGVTPSLILDTPHVMQCIRATSIRLNTRQAQNGVRNSGSGTIKLCDADMINAVCRDADNLIPEPHKLRQIDDISIAARAEREDVGKGGDAHGCFLMNAVKIGEGGGAETSPAFGRPAGKGGGGGVEGAVGSGVDEEIDASWTLEVETDSHIAWTIEWELGVKQV